jgi:AraC family transcriptional regulator
MITIYHDNPDITDDDKLRISIGMSVPADTPTDGEIGKMTIPAGKFAVAHFEISPDQYGEAWNMVYGEWMPESGYQPDDRLCYELYLNDPEQHPEHKHIVDIYAPVKPL